MAPPRRYPDHAARQRAYRDRQAGARAEEQQAKGLPPEALLPTLPSRARWQALFSRARLALETARDEMQDYYDDRTEAWQQGERAAALAEQIEQVEGVLEELDALADG